MVQQVLSPSRKGFLYGLMNCSFSFYLFSFQGKSISFLPLLICLWTFPPCENGLNHLLHPCSTWEVYSAATSACKPFSPRRASYFSMVDTSCLIFYVSSPLSWQTDSTIYGVVCSLYSSVFYTWSKIPEKETWSLLLYCINHDGLSLFVLIYSSYGLLNHPSSWEVSLPLWCNDYAYVLPSILVLCILLQC